METEKQSNELFNSVEFLFAKPCYQGHYMYALDNLESMSVIDKDSLRQLLIQLKCYDFVRTNYLLDRNLPIFFNAKEKRIEESLAEKAKASTEYYASRSTARKGSLAEKAGMVLQYEERQKELKSGKSKE